MTHSIFNSAPRSGPRSSAPIVLQPPAPVPQPRASVASRAPAPCSTQATAAPPSSSWEDALLAILAEPLHAGESAFVGFARKEVELQGVLATLGARESHALEQRLSTPQPDDRLAEAFQRLMAERRRRLLRFLADVDRRQLRAGR